MIRNPNIRNPRDDAQRLTQRITWIVALASSILMLISIGVLVTSQRSALATQHRSSIERVSREIQDTLTQYQRDALTLAELAPPAIFELGETPSEADQELLHDAEDMLEAQPGRYRSISYLDIRGIVRAQIENLEGMIYDRLGANAAFLPMDFELLEDTVRALEPGQVFLQVASDAAGLARVDLFTLAREDGITVGIIYVAANPTELLTLLNNAQGTIIEDVTERQVFWLSEGVSLLGQDRISNLPQDRARLPQIRALNESNPDRNYTLASDGRHIFSSLTFSPRTAQAPVWQLVITDDFVSAYAAGLIGVLVIVLVGALTAAGVARMLTQMIVPYLQRINETESLIRRVASTGSAQESIFAPPVSGESEATEVQETIHGIAERIQTLSAQLEERTAQRNRDLQMAGRIGRETAHQRDLDSLVRRAINMICNELGVYHAQVFLLDASQTYAELKYSRGEAGEQMLAQAHRLAVGSQTVIGRTTAEQRPIVVNDTLTSDEPHLYNPLLPETRAEMGLPLMVADEVIGALDIQSRRPHAFAEEDLAIYRLLADQLAVAIYNARLHEQAQSQIEQINRLNRRTTRQDWQDFQQRQDETLELGMVADEAQMGKASIRVRGTVIGELKASLHDGQPLSKGDQIILDAVAERVAVALENARLIEETQFSLNEVQTLYTLSSKLNEADSLQEVLKPILETVAVGATRAQIWLFRQEHRPDEIKPNAYLAADVRTEDMATIPLDMGREISLEEHPVLQALTSERALCIEHLDPAQTPMGQRLMPRAKTEALVVIPLFMRQSWKGFIAIAFPQERHFSENERRLYNALISQAGQTIDNRLLLEQTEQALTQQERLYAASRKINAMHAPRDLVEAMVMTNDAPYTDFMLIRLEGERQPDGWTNQARIIAHSDDEQIFDENLPYPLQVSHDSPMHRREPEIFRSERPLQQAAGLLHPAMLQRRSYHLLAFFPLFSENYPTALLVVASVEIRELTPRDHEFYRALTGQMSTQIERLRAQEQMQDLLLETRRLYVATRQISGAQSAHAVYAIVSQHVRSPLEATSEPDAPPPHVSITMLLAHPDPVRDAPYLREVYQWPEPPVPGETTVSPVLHQRETLPFDELLVANDESVVIFREIADEIPQGYPELMQIISDGWARSAAVVGMWTSQRWLGVMIVRVEHPDLLDQDYANYLESISTQAAIALENQLLVEESENERRRLQTILDSVPTGVLVLDGETLQPMQHNQRAEELLGREIDYDQPFRAVDYDIQRTGTHLPYPEDELPTEAARKRRTTIQSDDIAIDRGGIFNIDLLLSAAPVLDDNGQVTAIVAGVQDVSTMRGMEKTMQENLRETVLLYETQRAVSEAETLEELLDNLIAQLQLQQPSDAYILLQEADGNAIDLARYSVQPLPDVHAIRPLLRPSLVNINDIGQVQSQPELYRALSEIGARSVLTVPMRSLSRNQPLGWIMLVDTHPEAYPHDQERVMTSMSEMASTSIENKYLIASTRAALEATAALYAATTGISRSRDRNELIGTIRTTLETMEADMFAVYLHDTQMQTISELLKFGFREAEEEGLDLEELVTRPLPEADIVYVRDREHRDETAFGRVVAGIQSIQAFAAVDLQVQGDLTGRIFVAYAKPHIFDDNDRRYLGAVADSTSVVLDNQALLAQVQSTLQEQSVLYQASKSLSQITQAEEVIDVVVDYVIEPHINQVFVATLNTLSWDSPNALARIVSSWQGEDALDLQGLTFSADDFPAWKLMAERNIIAIGDIYDDTLNLDPAVLESIAGLDARSLAIIPLRIASQDIGVVWMSSREPHSFQDRDYRIYQAFAEQTSRALQASYLLEQTERRARQLETSAIIGQSVGQLLDLNVLLPEVVQLLRAQFNWDHVQVFLMDDANEYALLTASTGEAGQQLLRMEHKLPRGSASVIGQVTEHGVMTIAQDTTAADVIHMPNPQLPLTRSEIAMPLFSQGQVVGALDVQSNVPNAFTEEDMETLETLAAQISVAIENARLYEKAEQQAREMGFLFNIITDAAASKTIDEALQRVAADLSETVNAHAVVIYMPQAYEDLAGNRKTYLESRAIASLVPLDDLVAVEMGETDNLIGLVATDVQPRIIRQVEQELLYAPLSERTRSACLMPIASGETLIGLMQLESNRSYAFNDETINLLRALGSSLSVIIQNTQLVEQLGETVERLREVDRLKSQFLANMSHELRTPLNSIIGFSRVMLKGIGGPLTDMQEQDLQTIYNSGNHLLNLINEILDQAKIERNELKIQAAPFDVKPMIESVKSIAIGLMKDKDLKLYVEIAPNVKQAFGDEFRSRQILLNLVNNAIKFTPEGHVAINAYRVEEENGRQMIRIDVHDTGIGIAAENIEAIFQQFQQVDSSLTRTAGGTGLGLPISRALAEMQGGELVVESDLGAGSTFSYTIPVDAPHEGDEEQAPDGEHEPDTKAHDEDRLSTGQIIVDKDKLKQGENSNGTPNGRGQPAAEGQHGGHEGGGDPNATVVIPKDQAQRLPRTKKKTKTVLAQKRQILLIEDNKDMVDHIRRILQPSGFEVLVADHPLYAETMVGQIRPNVVVLDVNFADGSGWDMLGSLKERDDSFDIPVIVTTLATDSERAYRMGAHTFIQRPFTPQELTEAVLAAEKESRRERILIIDDQPEALRLLAYLLDEHGDFRVFTAQSGEEGISMVARRRPDLVILDLRMPEMDGFAVLDELRGNPETANIPVLVVTGDVDFSAAEQEVLENIRVVPKTDISQEEYARFIANVRAYLEADEDAE